MDKFPGFPKEPSNNYWPYPKALNGWWHALTGSEQKVLDYILRHTWGFKKTADRISYSQFIGGIRNCDKGCGIVSPTTLSNAIKGLIDKGFVSKKGGKITGKASEYSLSFANMEEENYDLPPLQNLERGSTETVEPTSTETVDTIKETTINDTNKELYIRIFDFWNSKEIIKHKFIDGDMKKAINKRIKNYCEGEITQAISNYSEILFSDKYFFKYKWTLTDFLQRGFDKFKDLETAKQNYTANKKIGGFIHPNQPEKGKYDDLVER